MLNFLNFFHVHSRLRRSAAGGKKRHVWAVWVFCFSAFLSSGCGNNQVKSTNAASVTLNGIAMGGQQPISEATIQVYAVGTSGDGSQSSPLLTSPVLTNSSGEFGFGGPITCPSASSLLYLTATGGNPGFPSSVNNPQIATMVALGRCDSLSATTYISVNEITTVAAAYALAPYTKSYSQVGSGTADAAMLADAFTLANELANSATGKSPGSNLPAGQSVPTSKLYTLATILSGCINSLGGTANDCTACGSLMSLTTPSGGTSSTDTIGAMVSLAQNPTLNVAAIYYLASAAGPFQPMLAAPPADWTLTISSSVPSPVFSPAPGTYNNPISVSISDTDTSASIFYTTDGSTPTASSTMYTGPIGLTGSNILRSVAAAAGVQSGFVAGTYTVLISDALAFSTQPSSAAAGSVMLPSPVIVFTSPGGAIDTSMNGPVTLQLNAALTGATLSGTTTVSAVNGVATFAGLSISAPGSGYTLTASSASGKSVSSATFNIGAPTLTMSLPASSINVGSVLSGTLVLSVPTSVALNVTLLTSSPTNVQLAPTSIQVPAGQTAVNFSYSGLAAGSSGLSASALGYAPSSVSAITVTPVTFRQAAAPYGVLMGAAADADEFGEPNPLVVDPMYASTLSTQYSMLEGENAMKWMVIGANQGSYNFEPGDTLVTFAQANQMLVRGHNLCWNAYNPSWLTGLTSTALSQTLHDYIFAVLGHYHGKVFAWDVVNEAISDSATGVGTTLKDSIWYDQPGIGLSGTGYVEQAFRWARQADPTVELFYNDYGIEVTGNKSQALLNMLTDFIARGVPIDGVGLQMHVDTASYYPATFPAMLKAYTDLGLQVHITEMDVRIPVNANGNASAADLQAQANTYAFVVSTCLKNPLCTAIQTWGFTDKYSWLLTGYPGYGAGLPFDMNYAPKPAVAAIMNAFQ